MKKIFVFLFVFITVSIICLYPKKASDEIVFWTLQMHDYAPYINKIISEYEKQNNVKIKWIDVPFSEGEKRTLSAVLSDNPPDLINLNPDFSVLLAQKGVLYYIDREKLSDFADEIVNSLSYQDKIYAIPWYATSAVTFYNKSYTNIIPKTFDDLPVIAEKTKNHYIYMPTITENDTMVKILNKYGINSADNINSKEAVKVFKLFRDMYRNNQIPKESVSQTHREALEKYMSGQIVYFQGGANFLNMIRDNAPDIYKNTDVAPQIKGTLGQNDFSLMNLIIPVKSKHKDKALDFALYLTNAENQLELAKLTNIISTNKKILKNDFYNKYDDLLGKARCISAGQLNKVNPVLRQYKNQKEINYLINNAVQDILINNADIQKTLDNVSTKWKELSD